MIIQQITEKFGVQNDRNFISSPLEASALLHLKWIRCERLARDKPVAKRHHMVSGTLAPFYTVFGLKLGCSGAAALIGDKVL